MVQNTAFGTDPTATPHPTHGQARPDNRRDTVNPLLLVQRHKPPPQTPRRRWRYGLGPPPLPSGPFSGPRRHTDNRSQNLKRTPLQRLADSRQQGTPVQTHLRNRRRNLRGEEPGTEGGGRDSR